MVGRGMRRTRVSAPLPPPSPPPPPPPLRPPPSLRRKKKGKKKVVEASKSPPVDVDSFFQSVERQEEEEEYFRQELQRRREEEEEEERFIEDREAWIRSERIRLKAEIEEEEKFRREEEERVAAAQEREEREERERREEHEEEIRRAREEEVEKIRHEVENSWLKRRAKDRDEWQAKEARTREAISLHQQHLRVEEARRALLEERIGAAETALSIADDRTCQQRESEEAMELRLNQFEEELCNIQQALESLQEEEERERGGRGDGGTWREREREWLRHLERQQTENTPEKGKKTSPPKVDEAWVVVLPQIRCDEDERTKPSLPPPSTSGHKRHSSPNVASTTKTTKSDSNLVESFEDIRELRERLTEELRRNVEEKPPCLPKDTQTSPWLLSTKAMAEAGVQPRSVAGGGGGVSESKGKSTTGSQTAAAARGTMDATTSGDCILVRATDEAGGREWSSSWTAKTAVQETKRGLSFKIDFKDGKSTGEPNESMYHTPINGRAPSNAASLGEKEDTLEDSEGDMDDSLRTSPESDRGRDDNLRVQKVHIEEIRRLQHQSTVMQKIIEQQKIIILESKQDRKRNADVGTQPTVESTATTIASKEKINKLIRQVESRDCAIVKLQKEQQLATKESSLFREELDIVRKSLASVEKDKGSRLEELRQVRRQLKQAEISLGSSQRKESEREDEIRSLKEDIQNMKESEKARMTAIQKDAEFKRVAVEGRLNVCERELQAALGESRAGKAEIVALRRAADEREVLQIRVDRLESESRQLRDTELVSATLLSKMRDAMQAIQNAGNSMSLLRGGLDDGVDTTTTEMRAYLSSSNACIDHVQEVMNELHKKFTLGDIGSRLTELEAALASRSPESEERAAQVASLQNEIVEYQIREEDTSTRLEEAQKLKGVVDDLRRRLDETTAASNSLEKNQREEMQAKEAEIFELNSIRQAIEPKIQSAQETITYLETELKDTTTMLELERQEIGTKETLIETLQLDVENAKKETLEKDGIILQLQKDNLKANQEVEITQARLQGANEVANSRSAIIVESSNRIAELETELRLQRDDGRQKIESLEQHLHDFVKKKEEVERLLEAANAKSKLADESRSHENESLAGDINHLSRQLAESRVKANALDEQLEESHLKLTDSLKMREQLMRLTHAQEEDIKILRKRLDNTSEEMDGKYRTASLQAEGAMMEASELRRHVIDLEHQLRSSKMKEEESAKQYTALEESAEKQKKELFELQNRIADGDSSKTPADNNFISMTDHQVIYEAMSDKINDIEGQLGDERDKLGVLEQELHESMLKESEASAMREQLERVIGTQEIEITNLKSLVQEKVEKKTTTKTQDQATGTIGEADERDHFIMLKQQLSESQVRETQAQAALVEAESALQGKEEEVRLLQNRLTENHPLLDAQGEKKVASPNKGDDLWRRDDSKDHQVHELELQVRHLTADVTTSKEYCHLFEKQTATALDEVKELNSMIQMAQSILGRHAPSTSSPLLPPSEDNSDHQSAVPRIQAITKCIRVAATTIASLLELTSGNRSPSSSTVHPLVPTPPSPSPSSPPLPSTTSSYSSFEKAALLLRERAMRAETVEEMEVLLDDLLEQTRSIASVLSATSKMLGTGGGGKETMVPAEEISTPHLLHLHARTAEIALLLSSQETFVKDLQQELRRLENTSPPPSPLPVAAA